MGKRENYLSKIVNDIYGLSYIKIAKPDFYKSEFNKEIKQVYLALDGIGDTYPTRYFRPDNICSDFSIELDEERHFNRYRLIIHIPLKADT
ncbi:MAG: hypothetical protein KAX05_08365, partial [Bacteroidales bacterium]|nr:hypothetical protein [Bacteroidales bacterium]